VLSVHLCFGFAPHMGQRTDSICPSVSFAGFTFIVFRIAHLEDGQSCSFMFLECAAATQFDQRWGSQMQ
jgi:hypothetical protein